MTTNAASDQVAILRTAMNRAFQHGQTYWQQADSESYSQNRKSDETERKFRTLVDETCSALAAPERAATQPAGEAVAWMDQYGNTFPLGAFNPSWKANIHDAHKRGWTPLYRAAPVPAMPAAPAEPVQAVAVPECVLAWRQAESARRAAVAAHNAAVLEANKHIWPGPDTDPTYQAMNDAGNKAHRLMLAMFDALAAAPAPAPSAPACNYPICKSEADQQEIADEVHVELFGTPAEAVSVREAALEEAAQACETLVENIGDFAVYDQRDLYQTEQERLSTATDCAAAIRALQGKPEARPVSVPAPDMSKPCRQEIIASGAAAVPRSCPRCGLSPVCVGKPEARPDVCAEMRALCSACGGTGDVTRPDGEWLGQCDCEASAWSRKPEATSGINKSEPCRNVLLRVGYRDVPKSCPRCGLAKECPAGHPARDAQGKPEAQAGEMGGA